MSESEETRRQSEETRREIKEAAARQLEPFTPVMIAYYTGYEQGRAQAQAVTAAAPVPPRPPRKGFTRDAWHALDDDEKVKILLTRLNPDRDPEVSGFGLQEITQALTSLNSTSRRHIIERLGSIFCMGCGDIQRIDDRGDLDWCQCQNAD